MKQYYGPQTEKASKNFPFSYAKVHQELIYAIAEIKEAAAITHNKVSHLSPIIAQAIIKACQEIRQGKHDEQFILPGFQGGAGTSINMNVNEVIAARAEEILREAGNPNHVHPNDDVNKSQSTNDVNPSALKIACLRLMDELAVSIDICTQAFEKIAHTNQGIDKLGRTHLQDAVPTTVSEEFSAYAETIKRNQKRLDQTRQYLCELNLGGTAIGNAINASVEYRREIYKYLQEITNLPLVQADNLMSQTSSQTDFLMVSQALVCLTNDLSKIANDIRLLSSGPHGGIGELLLPELQSGSSIMPGKVNPVLPETINQLYFFVSGNNLTIEQAVQAAQLELGVMFPIIADRLLSSFKLSIETIKQFTSSCISLIEVQGDVCKKHLEHSSAYATLLTPILGYDVVSALVKESQKTGKTIRELTIEKDLLSEAEFSRITHIHCTISKK